MMLAENGLQVPDDLPAFTSDGRLSDFNVHHGDQPCDFAEKRMVTSEDIWEMI